MVARNPATTAAGTDIGGPFVCFSKPIEPQSSTLPFHLTSARAPIEDILIDGLYDPLNYSQRVPVALLNGAVAPIGEVEVPYSSKSLFMTTGDPRTSVQPIFSESNSSRVLMHMFAMNSNDTDNTLNNSVVAMYRSTGEDFRFHFIKGCRASHPLMGSVYPPCNDDIESLVFYD
jgi:hypothetical protein